MIFNGKRQCRQGNVCPIDRIGKNSPNTVNCEGPDFLILREMNLIVPYVNAVVQSRGERDKDNDRQPADNANFMFHLSQIQKLFEESGSFLRRNDTLENSPTPQLFIICLL